MTGLGSRGSLNLSFQFLGVKLAFVLDTDSSILVLLYLSCYTLAPSIFLIDTLSARAFVLCVDKKCSSRLNTNYAEVLVPSQNIKT